MIPRFKRSQRVLSRGISPCRPPIQAVFHGRQSGDGGGAGCEMRGGGANEILNPYFSALPKLGVAVVIRG